MRSLFSIFIFSHFLLSASFSKCSETLLNKDSVIKVIQNDNPHLSKEEILRLLSKNQDKHMFLRTFYSLFHYEFNQSLNCLSLHRKLKKIKSYAFGDVHFENFGFLINDEMKPKFMINDFDKIHRTQPYADVLRLLLSSVLVENKIDTELYLSFYLKGLKGEEVELPSILKEIKKKALKKAGEYSEDDISYEEGKGYFFINQDPEEVTEVSDLERRKALFYLQLLVGPHVKIEDFYLRVKKDGGSAGLKRYQYVINDLGQIYWVELKQMFSTQDTAPRDKIVIAKSLFLSSQFNRLFDDVEIDNETYLFRIRDEGNKGVKLGKYSSQENLDIIYYEAFTLGLAHQLSLKSEEKYASYLKEFEKKKKKHWLNALNFFLKRFESLYLLTR